MTTEEPIVSQIKKSVTFIFTKSGEQFQPLGTGFFVGVRLDTSEERHAIYLVTAKHVLLSSDGSFHDRIYIRVNRHDNTSELVSIDFSTLVYPLHVHDDVAVDLAVLHCPIPEAKYDYTYITDELFGTPEAIKRAQIGEGEEIIFPGLLAQLFEDYTNNVKNYPVLRFGKVSLMTDEKIQVNMQGEAKRLAHVYLFECQSISGFSGAPVFFRLSERGMNRIIRMNSLEVYLAGVMKGHYNDFRINPVLELKDNILRDLNTGIALVTPCYLLRDLLNSEVLLDERAEIQKKLRAA